MYQDHNEASGPSLEKTLPDSDLEAMRRAEQRQKLEITRKSLAHPRPLPRNNDEDCLAIDCAFKEFRESPSLRLPRFERPTEPGWWQREIRADRSHWGRMGTRLPDPQPKSRSLGDGWDYLPIKHGELYKLGSKTYIGTFDWRRSGNHLISASERPPDSEEGELIDQALDGRSIECGGWDLSIQDELTTFDRNGGLQFSGWRENRKPKPAWSQYEADARGQIRREMNRLHSGKKWGGKRAGAGAPAGNRNARKNNQVTTPNNREITHSHACRYFPDGRYDALAEFYSSTRLGELIAA